jgi:hypothetical protein
MNVVVLRDGTLRTLRVIPAEGSRPGASR